MLEFFLGDLAKAVLANQKVYPKNLVEAGFSFEFVDIEKALENVLAKDLLE